MKIIYAFIFAAILSTSLQAQIYNEDRNRSERSEKMQNRIESQKIAFITQKLDLTPSEAQNFWPLYNEFQSNMNDFRRQSKLDLNNEDIREEDANGFLDNLFSREQEELDIKKRYFEKLKSAIPTKKIAKLYVLEKKFREEILANLKSRIGKKKRKMRNSNF